MCGHWFTSLNWRLHKSGYFGINLFLGAFIIGLSQISSFFSFKKSVISRVKSKLKPWHMDRHTDGRTDRQTDDGQSYPYVPLCFAGDAIIVYWEKGRDLIQSYDKSPYTHRKIKKNIVTTWKTPPKTSIIQRLRTDLGWSVGVTAVNPTGVVKPVYERSTFPLTATAL